MWNFRFISFNVSDNLLENRLAPMVHGTALWNATHGATRFSSKPLLSYSLYFYFTSDVHWHSQESGHKVVNHQDCPIMGYSTKITPLPNLDSCTNCTSMPNQPYLIPKKNKFRTKYNLFNGILHNVKRNNQQLFVLLPYSHGHSHTCLFDYKHTPLFWPQIALGAPLQTCDLDLTTNTEISVLG